MGVIDKLPEMVGVQSEGCSPITRAFLADNKEVESDGNPITVAGEICDGLTGYSKDGTYILGMIRNSNGFNVHSDDKRVLDTQKWLAVDERAFAKPSSAAAISSLLRSLHEKAIGNGETVVAFLTGHGLNDMNNVKLTIDILTVPNDLSKLLKLME